jgi:hypothetical protein
MKNKKQLAEEYAQKEYSYNEFSSWTNDYDGFIMGYNAAIEKVKEYLFNTEEHQNKDDAFYISEEYLKQTIKFLNEQ